VNREIEIGKEQARAEGKPEDLLEKIATGKLNKFFQRKYPTQSILCKG